MTYSTVGHEPPAWLIRRKVRGLVRRLRRLEISFRRAVAHDRRSGVKTIPPVDLLAGDWVVVRPWEVVAQTLDGFGRCRGCTFVRSMRQFCGRQFRVLRPVQHFFDEARWRMVRCSHVVLLEGVHCDGSGNSDTVGCDRMCFYFWRTEWLRRVDPSASSC